MNYSEGFNPAKRVYVKRQGQRLDGLLRETEQ